MSIIELGCLVLLPVIGLAIAGLWLMKRGVIGRPRAKEACWQCRFDLGASRGVSDRCPECGSEVLEPGVRPRTSTVDRVRYIVLGLLCLAPVGFIALAFIQRSEQVSGPEMDAGLITSAGDRAVAFVEGGGNEDVMRRALDRGVRQLAVGEEYSHRGMDQRVFEDGRNVIRSGWSNEGTSKLAEALDSRGASEERFGVLIDAWGDAYERHDVVHSTQADEIIASMLAGRWLRDASSSSADYSSTEAAPRELTQAQAHRLSEMILNVQGDPERGWNPLLGQGMEEGYARGVVSNAQITRYLEQAFDPRIVLLDPPPIRSGDVVLFVLDPGWRLGSSIPIFVRLRSAGPESAGRASGHIVGGELTMPNSHRQQLYHGVLALPDRVGENRFEFVVEVAFGPDVIDAYKDHVNPWHHEREEPVWRKMPGMVLTQRIGLDLELVESDAVRSELGPGEMSPEDVASAISVYASYDTCPDGTFIDASFSSNPRCDMAMDVYVRQDGREHPLGWLFWFRAGMWSAKVSGLGCV